jgi:hypothetical protein
MSGMLFLLSLLQAVERVDVPVAELNAPFVGFTCSKDGLPTVRMEHRGAQGMIHFGQHDPSSSVAFDLQNSVQSVVSETQDGGRRWIISAEGPVQNGAGIADGTRATVLLTIHRPVAGPPRGDFTVRAGDFSRSEAGCMPMPMPTRLLGNTQ